MKVVLLATLAVFVAACKPGTDDPESFLRDFATAENRNETVVSDGGMRFEAHLLNADYFAARDLGALPGTGHESMRAIAGESRKRYGQFLHYLVRISREGASPVVDGLVDPPLVALQRELQAKQESLHESIFLRTQGRQPIKAAQVIVTNVAGPKPSVSLLIVFPIPETSHGKWEYLSLAGVRSLPIAHDFQLCQLRPNLRLKL